MSSYFSILHILVHVSSCLCPIRQLVPSYQTFARVNTVSNITRVWQLLYACQAVCVPSGSWYQTGSLPTSLPALHLVWLSPSSWVPPVNQLSVTVYWCWSWWWWCPSSGHLHRPGCLVTVRPISGSVIAESLASLYQSSAVGRHKHWYLTICMCGDNTVQPVYVVNVWTQLDTAGC